LESSGFIVAYLPNVSGRKAKPLAGDEGCGDLSPGLARKRYHTLLSSQWRKFADHEDRIRCVQPQSDDVHFLSLHLISPDKNEVLDAIAEALSAAT
jgi:hypothetical protein